MILYFKGPDFEHWNATCFEIPIGMGWTIWIWSHWMYRGGRKLESKRRKEYRRLKKEQEKEDADKARVGKIKWCKAKRHQKDTELNQLEAEARRRRLAIRAEIEACQKRQEEIDVKDEAARQQRQQRRVEKRADEKPRKARRREKVAARDRIAAEKETAYPTS
jgi:hypothetical protein